MNKYVKWTLVAAGVGGVGYLTYRAYLKYQEDLEEEITMDEAMEEINIIEEIERRRERRQSIWEDREDESEENSSYYTGNTDMDKPASIFDIPVPDIDQPVPVTEGNPVYNHFNDKLSEGEEIVEVMSDKQATSIFEEEREVMRYDKNSIEAWEQYVDMRLAEIDSEEVSRLMVPATPDIMRKLFSVEFTPANEKDAYIKKHIQDERRWFFGDDSKYIRGASFAELILHFAEYADQAIDGDVINYCDEWIHNMGITLGIGEASLNRLVNEVQDHVFETPYGYGLFGLDEEQQERVYSSSERNVIGYLTFQIEFNVYLNDLIDVVDEDELDIEGYDYD